ncbi:PadR family transcriptional regulator [Methanobacterium formicicum]|jgi:DNA-binding PadR family transcriptional regulator|uniref:PadR-like family transcriptional regulator n=2 Tax=Methanobacterium formicicum TaxID=2162 RepID=A0A089ZGP6_METFO|nr:PadR family transcriptional regulator [Methanobacterium formicicum]AIS31348.1 PadR-like family transcriptional regulator [Methanobacterium formicicum]CEL25198.1 hypothetical protein MB9_1563 [Methanobacterium formicicum]
MREISNQETAVLGLLYEYHHYAYRIREIMEKRGMDNWADVDYSTLPPILKSLEKEGLIRHQYRNEGIKGPEKVYHITEKGKSLFKRQIKSILSEKGSIIYSFDLGLANMTSLNQEEIIQSLKIYLKSIEERIHVLSYSIKIQEENNVPYNFIAIYSRNLSILKAEKEWLIEFMDKIQVKGK